MEQRMVKKMIGSVTAAQFEEAMAQYAAATAQETNVQAIIDTETARIRSKYADELAYLKGRRQNTHEVILTYCREQKAVLFSKRRSMGTFYGSVGFRLGQPRFKTLRNTTWAQVLERMKELLPAYVRTNEEPAKDLLLAHRQHPTVAPLLQQIGLQVVQDELFYIDLNKPSALAA